MEPVMLTKMTDEVWEDVLEVCDAAQSERSKPGHCDRKFLEALLYFTVHSITWQALPASTWCVRMFGRRRKRGGKNQALGRSRGGFSSKIHLKTDFDGLPIALHLTGG
jgi:hypothetical protein